MARCAPFERAPSLAVAVSGGVDSMGLLHLAHGWAQARGGSVTALTVNHHLRDEAAAEVAQVAQWCAGLGIFHHTLHWEPPEGRNQLQANAREGRYALMSEWCRAQQVLHLLCAHTRDDQCETLFFRLARGSQMEGLAGMPLVKDLHGVRLLRPLLGTTKGELKAYLQAIGQAWVEDASNHKPVYSRNHIRLQLAEGVNAQRVSEQASGLTHAFAAIRNALFLNNVSFLTDAVCLYPEGYARIDGEAIRTCGQEEGVRLLGALLPALGGEYHPPRADALQRLWEGLSNGQKRSLAGFVFSMDRHGLLVTREKAALPEMQVLHGNYWEGRWDGRFSVCFDNSGPLTGFSLAPLGKAGVNAALREVKLPSALRVPPALKALPALWHLEALVAAPHIGYRDRSFKNIRFEAMFCPAKPLADSPFFSFNTAMLNPLQER